MFKKTILSVFLLGTLSTFAQVGIGTTTPAAGSILDIDSPDKGLLIPRVSLIATNNPAPITPAPVEGMMVYNTATGGTSPNIVQPGFYFWNGALWTRVATGGAVTKDWAVGGNGDIDATTDFIGTTNNQDLRFKTNDVERMRILNAGVVINTPTPLYSIDRFTVLGAEGEYAINGYTSNGVAIYGENTGTGYGMAALNTSATGAGIIGSAAGAGLASLAGTGGTFNGSIGAAGFSNSATGTGITGTGNNGNMAVINPNGGGIAGSGTRNGVFGYAGNGAKTDGNWGNSAGRFVLDSDNNPMTNENNTGTRATAILAGFDNVAASGGNPVVTLSAADSYFGGYFSGGTGNNPAYSYVALKHNTANNGNGGGGTNYKIIGSGTVSTIINDDKGTPRILFAPEAPEILFQDFGVGKLVNGQVRIELDPVLKKSLHIDKDHPLKVYVTLEGECNGVFVTNKTADGFTVKELNGGTSNVEFSWQIVASRADTKDANGNITSKHVGLRLPIGPGPLADNPGILMETKELKIQKKAPETVDNVK